MPECRKLQHTYNTSTSDKAKYIQHTKRYNLQYKTYTYNDNRTTATYTDNPTTTTHNDNYTTTTYI